MPDYPENPLPACNQSRPPEEDSTTVYPFDDRSLFPSTPLAIVNGLYNESSRAGAITLSNVNTRNGAYAVRFELTKADAAKYNPADTNAYLYERAELTRITEDLNCDRWYRFSSFLPANFVADPAWDLISQLKPKADAPEEAVRPPSFSILIRNDRYYVAVRYSAEPINTVQSTAASLKVFDLGAVDKNTWTDWHVRIRLSYQRNGILEVWKNNREVLNYRGPNAYNDGRLPVFSIGVYKFDWETAEGRDASPEDVRVIYFDELKVGSQ